MFMRWSGRFRELGASLVRNPCYPRSGFSGGGGTSRKSFFRPERGCAILGVMVEGKLFCAGGGTLLGILGDGILLLCVLAFKIRRKNESRIIAKIASLTHELESIAGS